MRDYYKQRWAIFIDMANDCLATGTVWNQGAYTTKMNDQVQMPFQTSTKARQSHSTNQNTMQQHWIRDAFCCRIPAPLGAAAQNTSRIQILQ